VDHPVKISCLEDFLQRFGVPECHCRLEFAVRQFFANGGSNAVVVRVSGTSIHNRILLRGESNDLVLEARNPGPLEHLRASVDYDGIESSDQQADQRPHRFNLIVQRLRSSGSVWIDAQECYRNVSVDPANRDYLGYVLVQSDLVRLVGEPPACRPDPTIKPLTVRQAGYVEATAERVHSPPPTDYDLIGSAANGTGLSALEDIPDIGQICLLSGAEGESLGPVALLAADRFCRKHQSLLIVDPPARWMSVDDVLADQERSGYSSPNAVTWFPGVRLRNSQGSSVWTTVTGSVAAALNASDQLTGVRQLRDEEPVMLRSRVRLTAKLDQEDVRRLGRAGISGLIQRSPLHLQLLGNATQARYGSIAAEWNDLELRRRVLFIQRRIRFGTRWTFFVESSPELWREVTEQIEEFLEDLHDRSALVGDARSPAFYVRCDADTNAGLVGNIGSFAFVVGFSIRNPGEYLAFRFQFSGGDCRISELGWQTGFAQAS